MILLALLLRLVQRRALSMARTFPVKSPAEINTAMTTAQPGDTLLMARGVWTNAAITFKGNGAEGDCR